MEADIFVLFKDGVDLQDAIKKLKEVNIGSVFPLSARKLDIGALIIGVKEDSLADSLDIINNCEFVRFADVLCQPHDPLKTFHCRIK